MEASAAQYHSKRCTARQLAEKIRPGSQLWVDIGLAQPKELLREIGALARAGDLRDVSAHTMLDIYPAPWYQEETENLLHGVSWFSGTGARGSVNRGRADVMPCYYRDIPALLRENPQIDCICAAASPMDRHGYFSLGCTNSASEEFLTRARCIYLEVNRQMPRSLSAPMVHISQVTAFCESDYALPVMPAASMDEVSLTIGAYIAERVPNGATIQLGIGAIPEAVGRALTEKCDLGIHTELFTDSMMELIECGAVTNRKKPLHRGRSVATFAYGSKRIYDYIDDNPAVELLPVDYVNDPRIIAQHPDFISVNSAAEVDLWGQVCAESVGTRHLSGTGGQADFVRGAVESSGGMSFIAFPSTARDGQVSRIRATLTPGAIVTTSKNDVDCIVTEYGIARLRGRSLSQRARALIAIAHPAFRDELRYEAKRQHILC